MNIEHNDVYEGKPFSKFLEDIKLVCLLKADNSHDIQDLWKSQNCYFAFFHGSGLRSITGDTFNRLKNNFGISLPKK